jgi:uncharacterized protein (TIGR03067 family)
MRKTAIVTCVLFGLFSTPFVLGAGPDEKEIQGTWKPQTAELGGKPYPQKVLEMMTLTLGDGTYAMKAEQLDEGTVKLMTDKTPRAMDIKGTRGPNKGKTIPAIYELKDDTLRICYDLSGKARPEEFKTETGTLKFLVIYKREKP